ncbi:MAG: hypothetical protein JW986_09630 [Methanotrichaceae archaeon]|nr:hypothetical protein [Methanotrichaceae archaeon]
MATMLGMASAGAFTLVSNVETYIDEAQPDVPFADEQTLWATSIGGEPIREVYLGFQPNFGTVGATSPDIIDQATLTISVSDIEESGGIYVYFLHGETLETFTWDDRNDYDLDPRAASTVAGKGTVSIDATDLVKKAVETCYTGCPFSLIVVAQGDASIGLEKGTAELVYRTLA